MSYGLVDGGGQVLCHDSWENVLTQLQNRSIDLLLSDPPYAATKLAWDKVVDWERFWVEAERICKPTTPVVLFASGKFVNKLINTNARWFRYELIWEKTMPVGFLDANRRPLRAHENILIFIKQMKGSVYNPQMIKGKMHARGSAGSRASHYGTHRRGQGTKSDKFYPRSILRFSNRHGNRSLHPTQKPLELIEWLILTYSNRGDLVLDPFVGSGTTLVAAKRNRRRAIGVEIEDSYCRVATTRLEQEG